MVIGIVGELKDVWGKSFFVPVRISVVAGVLLECSIGIGRNIFMWITGDKAGGADRGVDVVCKEALPQAGENSVVRNGRELGDVGHRLKTRMDAGLTVHRQRRMEDSTRLFVTGQTCVLGL